MHQADLTDDTSTHPSPAGLDVLICGLTLTSDCDTATSLTLTVTVTDRLFDGLYEHIRQHLLTGRPPA